MAAIDETVPARPLTVARRVPAAAVAPAPRRAPMPWLQPGIFIGALVPLASIVWRGLQGDLTANPIAQVMNELGLSALIFLVASLACTPARWLFGWSWPVRIRRELGLFAFFYAVLHFLVYLLLDQVLDLSLIVEDIALRPFITVGFLALVLLTPLALTSTNASVRRLGFRRWQRIHQLAYVAGVLAIVHFIWRVKIDLSQPLIYGSILGVLLLVRVAFWLRQRSAQAKAPSPSTRSLSK
jgi:sulfoxide reductase heme-binding subunit YedZ